MAPGVFIGATAARTPHLHTMEPSVDFTFLQLMQHAWRLDPAAFVAIQQMPMGVWLALSVVCLAALSEALGQSVVLFLNRIRPERFGLALLISAASNVIGFFVWTAVIALLGHWLFGLQQPLPVIAAVIGLAYAPQLFSFFELTPFLGNLIWGGLAVWNIFAAVVALRFGLGLQAGQAILLAGLGWLLIQAMRRTVGRPILRFQRWLQSRAAGVRLVYSSHDVSTIRRRHRRTWYHSLESWRERYRRPPPTPPAPGSEE